METVSDCGLLGQGVARDARDERHFVWEKLQSLRVTYLNEMIELYAMLTSRSNQSMPAEQLQKLKHYKGEVHRMVSYLQLPQTQALRVLNRGKVDALEKQIENVMEKFQRTRDHTGSLTCEEKTLIVFNWCESRVLTMN